MTVNKKLGRGGKDRLKPPNHGPPSLTGRSTAHSATAQPEGGVQDIDPREWVGHNKGIFLTKPKIRPQGESNTRPRGATQKP
jgi:hypothetical protein